MEICFLPVLMHARLFWRVPLSNTHYVRIIWWCWLLVGGACPSAWGITIAKDGASVATIVVADGSSEAVRHAARELQFFLKEVTGAEPTLAGEGKPGSPRILVGPQAAKMADAGFATEELGAEGLVIRTVGRDLILSGGEPRGTLYAVYTFLEDYVGCHWWTADASTIPRRRDLKFDKLDVRYVPPFDYREPHWDTARNRDWAVRNKVFGMFIPLDAETGGRPTIAAASHSFFRQIPASRYFQSHPEWFSEVNGKRIPGRRPILPLQRGPAARDDARSSWRACERRPIQRTFRSPKTMAVAPASAPTAGRWTRRRAARRVASFASSTQWRRKSSRSFPRC